MQGDKKLLLSQRSHSVPRTLVLADASDRHRRVYFWALAAIATVGVGLIPFARMPLPAVPEFNVFYVSGVIFGDLATAFLIFGQFRGTGRASLLVLATAYLFTATIVIPHLLFFSEFAPKAGWITGASQTAAWLWHAWHLAFPIAVLGYVAIERWQGDLTIRNRSAALGIAVASVVIFLLALMVVLTVFAGMLPQLHDARTWKPITFQLGWAMGLATVGAILGILTLPNRQQVLHLWLSVALIAFLFDVVLNMAALERFALGWYAGRVSGLLAATFLFVMLLREIARLYVSLGDALDSATVLNAELEQRVDERTAELSALNAHLTEAVRDRDILLSAVYHRVNNNLQSISALLLMERRRTKDKEARAAMERMARRVRAMGLVHHQIMRSRALHEVDLRALLRDLTASLWDSLALEERGLRLDVEADSAKADLDAAMPLGLLVNELVSNAVEHAFIGRESGRILVSLRRENGLLCLEVADNGIGMRDAPEGFGSQVIAGLVAQLDGRQEVIDQNGVCRRVLFSPGRKRS